ncbi:MAG: FAD-dependent oxidoreductase [Candidatus Pacebacteria bacterium]|nr:FAD-dependent oxidoreductase [Candidatus Paceibacterota bacterium]
MQTFIVNFEDKFEYNDRFVKLIFELKRPHTIDFQAGQYIKIKINQSLEQEYFFFSSPTIDHGFEILVDRYIKGPSMTYLENLKLGDELEITAPYGEFMIDEDNQNELIFVATDVGVAPFYSMILDLLQTKQSKRKITLYWGLDNLDEFFLYQDLELLEKNFPNFDFHPVISNALPQWTLCRGTVYDCLSIHEVNADASFYVCANQEISGKIKHLFLTNDVKEEQIKIAKYY